jgi:protease I
MNKPLSGIKIAMLVTDGFERPEMVEPRKALQDAGATVVLISPKFPKVKALNHTEWADEFQVDLPLEKARSADFDAIVLPGGIINPDLLRIMPTAIKFIKEFVDMGKPIAAICHGPWTLIETGFVKGKKMTSWKSLKTDLINAGAQWVDEKVVVDGKFVTSRMPADIPYFNEAVIKMLSKK